MASFEQQFIVNRKVHMKKAEFIQRLKPMLPQTASPIVPAQVIPLNDGLWVKTIETTYIDGDPIMAAKVAGLTNQQNQDGEIHIILMEKEEYSDADLERAIALIKETDVLSFDPAPAKA